jgi:hypothetical protein
VRRVAAIVVAPMLLGRAVAPPQPPLDWRGRTHVDVNAQDDVFTPANIIVTPA